MLSFQVNDSICQIGAASFFHSFFATIHCNLEADGQWGSRYPALLNELNSGHLKAARGAAALSELEEVVEKLKAFPPSAMVWNYKDRSAQPPWGDNISSHITDLSIYYVTSDGKDLIDRLRKGFEKMIVEKSEMIIV